MRPGRRSSAEIVGPSGLPAFGPPGVAGGDRPGDHARRGLAALRLSLAPSGAPSGPDRLAAPVLALRLASWRGAARPGWLASLAGAASGLRAPALLASASAPPRLAYVMYNISLLCSNCRGSAARSGAPGSAQALLLPSLIFSGGLYSPTISYYFLFFDFFPGAYTPLPALILCISKIFF